MKKIYLDHAATTPVHPSVADKMLDILMHHYGNPSSIHSFGRDARQILDEARTAIADSLSADFSEIIFTSGGTEADNLAIIGAAQANQHLGNHIITTAVEHHAVLRACEYLEKIGFEVTYLSPDEQGVISVEAVQEALRPTTILVTIMYANNEVGSIQPISEIGSLLSSHQAVFHTDAVQAYGALNINVDELGIDLLSISAHKINGPKGIGALYIRKGTKLTPNSFGGEQELKRRAGTENLPAVAGFAKAIAILQTTLDEKIAASLKMKHAFLETLQEENVTFFMNGSIDSSLPNILNISFPKTNVEAMLVNLDMVGIAASSGSACTAGSIHPSHVLVAIFGEQSDRIKNSVRFSFGYNNTLEEVTTAAKNTAQIAHRLQR